VLNSFLSSAVRRIFAPTEPTLDWLIRRIFAFNDALWKTLSAVTTSKLRALPNKLNSEPVDFNVRGFALVAQLTQFWAR
jgi:hypothetical protein